MMMHRWGSRRPVDTLESRVPQTDDDVQYGSTYASYHMQHRIKRDGGEEA